MAKTDLPYKPHNSHRPFKYKGCPLCVSMGRANAGDKGAKAEVQAIFLHPAHIARTPWAVICRQHGRVFMSRTDYTYQMDRPDQFWRCPICGYLARFDDDNYEAAMERGDG